ncbi:alcohol dehydrogenase catalytic domain-containing protein [Streptomyces nigra]|uniref:alcohol dehydrogenase catalytic domain-containing protein n=1 Tax=Streptomyces nigra TaxID=1827580 RepID=UPI0035DCE329
MLVLVRVHASAVNPLNTKIKAGTAAHARVRPPAVPGMDLAGRVMETGPAVDGFAAGDEVYGLTGGVGDLQGTLAQFAAIDARGPAPKPATLPMREAAALPLAVITAWEGPVDRTRVRAGSGARRRRRRGQRRGPDRHGPRHAGVRDRLEAPGRRSCAARRPYRSTTPRCPWTGTSPSTPAAPDSTSSSTPWAARPWTPPSRRCAPAPATRSARAGLGHPCAGTPVVPGGHSGVCTLLPMPTGRSREHHGAILRAAAAPVDDGTLRPPLDGTRHTSPTSRTPTGPSRTARPTEKVVIDTEP